jgi:hypothetical protein
MKRQPFGRRTADATCSNSSEPRVISRGGADAQPIASQSYDSSDIESDVAADISIDEELREWILIRRKNFRLPWRQVSLMASVCFGIGSFVLPASVNQAVQWPLLGFSVLSLSAGLFRARQRADKH